MKTGKIAIRGMNEIDHGKKVIHALNEVWGVTKVEVSLDKGEAAFTYDENAASLHDAQQAVIDCGFEIQS